MISNREVRIAECGACGHRNYVEERAEFTSGYYLIVTDYAAEPKANNGHAVHDVYACRETHIGKAVRNALRGQPEENEYEQGTGNGDQGGSRNEPPADTYHMDDSEFLDALARKVTQ